MGYRTEPVAVHIAHVLQKLHFLQFFNFFHNLHDLSQKQITHAGRKKKRNLFFLIFHTTYCKKKIHACTAKKNYMTRQFFVHELHFSRVGNMPWIAL